MADNGKPEMSDQTRAILAAALSLVIILGYVYFFKPATPPPAPPASATTATKTQPPPAAAASAVSRAPSSVAAVAASREQTVVIESDLYRVEFSNRGAVVRSWQLKKYTDSRTPPRTLDLVNPEVAQQTGGWPFSLQSDDPQTDQAANQGLYTIDAPGASGVGGAPAVLAAPAEVSFHWSDGHLDITKRVKFDRSYIASLSVSATRDGQPLAHRLAWSGGFGDVTAFREAAQMEAFTGAAGSITTIAPKNLGAAGQGSAFASKGGGFDAVGIEDLFFAAAFLPPEPQPGQAAPVDLTLYGRQVTHQVVNEGKTTDEILPEVAAGRSTAGPLAMRVFVGPKDIDLLKTIRPPLNGLVQFGWFGFVAEPLFYILRWLYRYVHNYGWAIILMTVAINMLLYPLKVKSWRGMQKMQKVAPEIKTINERYKKYSMRDPRKAEMQKEIMAVYSREGINPMGSCLPQVIQMPIWFGLYRMLNSTIELRHAPWIAGWVTDLSGRDPYYILTIFMGVLMYAAQKMTPMTATDPAQQRMMTLMPLMFVGMFFFIPVSSGLILYILTQNVVAVAQQWHLNRTAPLKPAKAKNK